MSRNRFVSSKGSTPSSESSPSTKLVCTYGMYFKIRLTCSDTCRTLSIPCKEPVFDLLPKSNHDSTPGRRALNPLRLSGFKCGSERSDRLLSAMKRAISEIEDSK